MINTIGLGKRRAGMSRRDSQLFHIENHAPYGRRVAGPLGMKRYIGGYPTASFDFAGDPLDEVPWDFIVPESFTDKFFNNIWEWRTTDPEGIAIAIDEQRHCDHQGGYMMLCDERAVIDSGNKKHYESAESTNIFLLEKRRDTVSHEQFVADHQESWLPIAKGIYGESLKDHTVYYVDEVYNLIEGKLKDCLYDAVEHIRVDLPFWETFLAWRQAVQSDPRVGSGNGLMDLSASAAVVCDVRVYVDHIK